MLTMGHDVHARLAKPQIAEQHGIKKGWEVRIPEADLVMCWIELEPKGGLQHQERCRARPGLRRAGDRVERRASTFPALKAAEQLRKTAQIHVGRGFEQAAEHLVDGMLVSVS